jgi:hypothetical protein
MAPYQRADATNRKQTALRCLASTASSEAAQPGSANNRHLDDFLSGDEWN